MTARYKHSAKPKSLAQVDFSISTRRTTRVVADVSGAEY
jgi:hypothetical protein